MVADKNVRARLVKGWAFSNLPEDVVEKIRQFLQDGDETHLEGTGYEFTQERLEACSE